MRLGLCCLFVEEDIRFRTTTASALSKLNRNQRADKLRTLAKQNAASLYAAIDYCANHGIGCFRVNSQILPLKTHPELGYHTDLLGAEIIGAFRRCGELARRTDTRISFHPDQFVVLSSPKGRVVENSLAELEYQAEVAEWIGADVINVHGGGGYGDKRAALERLASAIGDLSERARSRLTLENDDRTYTPRDLLPICVQIGLPLVYDVHHHRCHRDNLDVETATKRAIDTWNREPLFHVSSPRDGWRSDNPRSHSDYIDLRDFPSFWDELDITVEVEAKAKELAVRKLKTALERRTKRNAAQASQLSTSDRMG
ncbi:MAG: UV DNA damage repair endonuclease UvsE [Myxococcota bacterium]|nr:UV DNA damage repair endonuclease UvsE [Myxococcota bacterium]